MAYVGQRDLGFPYVEIDDVPFPLVENSFVQVSPLAPFSSALQAGSSSRISDSRLSVEVWDNFSGGLGLRDEVDLQVTSYAEGNLDTRTPGYVLPPPAPVAMAGGAISGFPGMTIGMEHMESTPPGGTDGWLIWAPNKSVNTIKTLRSGVYTARTSEEMAGFTAWNGAYYYAGWDGANQHLYKTVDTGLNWTTPYTAALAAAWLGLTVLDNKLITYEQTTRLVRQSLDGVTFTTHSTMPAVYANETITGLFTWFNPQRTRDTLWAFTPYHILWYEEESGEWHSFYNYTGIAYADYPAYHVWRRDENLYAAPTQKDLADNRGFIQMFTGQVADDVSPNERLGLPVGFTKNVIRLQGGVHWLYAWISGTNGGLYAFNEFQGWTMLFDPRMLATTHLGGTGELVGGGYDNGRLWVVVNVGGTNTPYELSVPDRREALPRTGTVYSGRSGYLRSAWTSHNQLAREKLAAYFEVDFRKSDGLAGLPSTDNFDVTLYYRANGINWLSQTKTVHPGDALPLVFELSNVFNYRQLQWEVRIVDSATVAVDAGYALASVALYYSYWQGNHAAYQFNIDLSDERWRADRQLRNYDRDELIATLLGFNTDKRYRTFRYKVGAQEFTSTRVDLLVAGREDAELGGGVYSVTVRDLAA